MLKIRFNNYIIFKTYTKCIITLFFFGFGINCTTNSVRSKAKIQNIDYLIDQGKLLWDQRLDSLALDKAEHFINLAHKQRK